MAYARHLMPQIGALEPGLWFCTAFGGHGLNTTAIGGQGDRRGDRRRKRPLPPVRAVRPRLERRGLAGRAAQVTYWALQAADRCASAGSLRGTGKGKAGRHAFRGQHRLVRRCSARPVVFGPALALLFVGLTPCRPRTSGRWRTALVRLRPGDRCAPCRPTLVAAGAHRR